MSRHPKLQRAKLHALIARELRRSVRQSVVAVRDGKPCTVPRSDVVEHVLETCLLWCSNSVYSRPAKETLRVALALLPLADAQELEHVADFVISQREQDRGASRDASYDTARRILAPLGVRYAACGCMEWAAGDSCCDKAQELADASKAAAERVSRPVRNRGER